LKGEQAQQVGDFVGAAQALPFEQVAVKIGADQFIEQALTQLRRLGGDDGGVAAPYQPALQLGAGFEGTEGGAEFGVTDGVKVKGQLPTGERFADFVRQIERGGARGEDAGMGEGIHQDFEVEADIGDALRLVNDQEFGIAEQFAERLTALTGKGFAVEQFVGADVSGAVGGALDQVENQSGLAHLTGAIQGDDFARQEGFLQQGQEQAGNFHNWIISYHRNFIKIRWFGAVDGVAQAFQAGNDRPWMVYRRTGFPACRGSGPSTSGE